MGAHCGSLDIVPSFSVLPGEGDVEGVSGEVQVI